MGKCKKTADSLVARLAIEHMALEGRELDVYLNSVKKFVKGNDEYSASLLTRIYLDDYACEAGQWFEYIMAKRSGRLGSSEKSLTKSLKVN